MCPALFQARAGVQRAKAANSEAKANDLRIVWRSVVILNYLSCRVESFVSILCHQMDYTLLDDFMSINRKL